MVWQAIQWYPLQNVGCNGPWSKFHFTVFVTILNSRLLFFRYHHGMGQYVWLDQVQTPLVWYRLAIMPCYMTLVPLDPTLHTMLITSGCLIPRLSCFQELTNLCLLSSPHWYVWFFKIPLSIFVCHYCLFMPFQNLPWLVQWSLKHLVLQYSPICPGWLLWSTPIFHPFIRSPPRHSTYG